MRRFLIVVMTVLGAAGLGQLPVSAAPVGPGRTVQIVGEQRFSPDEFFTITFRFTPRRIAVHTGETVTWNNRTTDVHTVSIVSPDQVPRTVDQVNNCAVCNQLLNAHSPSGPPPAPQVFVLDDFKAASPPATFDGPGDSVLIAPPGLGLPTSVSAQVTAPAGTTLNYICAFHAWMQGSIRVVGDNDVEDQ